MAAHNELGKKGEQIAVDYLIADNYEVLEVNYRFSRAEVDIIARKDGLLIFVEVKTRSSLKHGCPESGVNHKKVKLLMDTAYHYMEKINHDWEIRFDVIALLFPKNRLPFLKHIKDAFVP
ncbi:YraN family protein [Portibacter marinus]|uniref:YraN family protein n=1 Tax=Portibacter marinus TaxID=2898660 RepID=UPI001F2F2001|nr:YraN family protein [Portibacter marinus]